MSLIEVSGDMLCSYCFKPSSAQITLKRCSRCYRVSYCSSECQTKDWDHRHKRFCPRFQEVNKYDFEVVGESCVTLAELLEHQEKRREILKSTKQNQHEPCEECSRTIFKNEVVCEVCYKTPYQARPIKPFESCPKCRLVRYCSDDCKSKLSTVHSQNACNVIALFHATERTEIDYFLGRKRKDGLMMPSLKKRVKYVPMASYTDWEHYNRELSREFKGTPDTSIIFDYIARDIQAHSPQAIVGLRQLSTQSRSFCCTVIAGLEKTIPRILTYTSLEIHVVGASHIELGLRGMTEDILHHCPALKKLHVRFIGPEALPTDLGSTYNRACTDCQAIGGSRICSSHPELYHDYMQKNPKHKPDLIVCLNSGHSDIGYFLSWTPTLVKILDLDVPAIFTEYSWEEADYETRRLRGMGARFVLELEENRWRGVIPIFNRGVQMNHGRVLYSSQVWYAVNGRT
ncbi:hypothetical protein BDP27DRAFT_1311027 [Rhodocollybia butyracea]|uniref:MYND-type domain-containing protein n=1 Tax=Rhodocollybia butyracea TaxID=206335 RepID=A0A9P5UGC6_9AGAR|nr:hypothetical protein BDP27DRAFT_1311027 [Rhodocollybia butyracea]